MRINNGHHRFLTINYVRKVVYSQQIPELA